ncbi:MAG: ABC transporter permease subunit [Ardenticatenaceae bacterium]|nr:ABC transporter permease subunit [Ardenticatenaceae bacterium]MCB9445462.1 ABC transporter permease subunit [Ardenticatenaceae bacterium]
MTFFRNLTSQMHLSADVDRFIKEQVTKSGWLTLWLIVLTLITVRFVIGRVAASPFSTIIVLVLWASSLGMVAVNELRHKHTSVTLWMKNNLYNSITNVQLSLILTLALLAALFGLYRYAWTDASFTTYPATDIRAEVADISGSSYCFTIGGVKPAENPTDILDGKRTCFDAKYLTTDVETAVIGQQPANFCFDEMPDDPENGITCFESSASDPGFFEVTRTFRGANWGAVLANMTSLMIFRFDRQETWRIWAAIILIVVLAIPSVFVFRDSFKNKLVRRILTGLWLFSPIISYAFLRGVPDTSLSVNGIIGIVATAVLYAANHYITQKYPPSKRESEWIRLARYLLQAGWIIAAIFAVLGILNLTSLILGSFTRTVDGTTQPLLKELDPDVNWGGFLFTIIITVFSIVVSFPMGVLLALGRRSTVRGIPAWLTYLVAIAITIWGLINSTPANLAAARNTFEQILAFWPLFIPVVAFLFQRTWNGNVVAAFSTLYIEFVRGIPFIAVLFLTIVLFPILLPQDVEIAKVWRVMWGATLFAAAYLAENVRGGLQALSKGQYEAADSLGLSTVDKYRLIILPQALRVVIPAIVGQFIGGFKDTTLVAIVGFLDVLGVANAISAQPAWLGVRREAYLFLAVLYFVGSALMAGYSRRLEKQLGVGQM